MRVTAANELTRLAQEGDTIAVRNTLPGIAVFQDDNLNVSTTWEGSEDPNGGHIREISATALRNPDFRSSVLRGIFEIEDAPDALAAAVAASKAEWESRQQARADSVAAIDRVSKRTIARGKVCIAPKGRDVCGTIAMDIENRPPLCAEHAAMASQYIQVEGPEGPIWKRASH
jgi:hypothetical protein